MKQIIFIAIIVTGLIACGSKDKEKKFDNHTYEEQKTSLLDKEKNHPLQFLKIEGDDRRNIWGQTVYKGTITNKATLCSYRDVRVKLLYFKAGVQVANHEELFDNSISPNDDYSFKAKYKTPRGTDSVAVYIMSAKAADQK